MQDQVKKISTILLSGLFVFACAKTTDFSSALPANSSLNPPVVTGDNPNAQAPGFDNSVPADYIVVLKQNAAGIKASGLQEKVIVKNSLEKIEKLHQLSASIHQFSAALHGGVYKLTSQQAKDLEKSDAVAYVEKDQIVKISAIQSSAPWGLDRLDQATLPLDGIFNSAVTGAGVTAYVIDTGILTTHNEFQGRAISGYDFIDKDSDATDCNGHGTHVAGTIGGRTYGVAKNVNLVAVRVLDCEGSGSYASVIAGVDWVTANHKGMAVANMSLGGPISQALEDAIANSIKSGVTYALAAGNENESACLSSPSRMKEAIKVGSVTKTDQRSSFSNFGECVDIFAPGSDIESAWDTSPSSTNTISGTSMATPHATGVLALYLEKNKSATPAEVKSALLAGSLQGKILSVGTNSPNRLLNVSFLSGAVQPPPLSENVLQNGVATAALAGAKNSEKVLTIAIPAGAKNLVFEMSGGQPDADLYVKFAAKPTTTSYDCRS